MLSVQLLSSKLALCVFTSLVAVAATVVGSGAAHANPLSCDTIATNLQDRNSEVLGELSTQLAGKKHRLLVNKLEITGVTSVENTGPCTVRMVLGAKIDRKFRKDAAGTITIRARASGTSSGGSALDLTFDQSHIERVDLSHTKAAAETAYKVAGNFLVQDSIEVHLH
jgi:hypothetical protein